MLTINKLTSFANEPNSLTHSGNAEKQAMCQSYNYYKAKIMYQFAKN